MLLSHQSILSCIENGVIRNGQPESAGPVSYDLATQYYFADKAEYQQKLTSYTLNPGDSVFVSSVEVINLPADLSCSVKIKNSRIRQGLRLDAPLYFPGHETRVYFRVTNVSSDIVTLDTKKGIAQIVFERLDEPTDAPYEGAFSDEFSFKGMGTYESLYEHDLKKLEKKSGEIEGIEKRIYGNVMTLMAIFAAVFTLVNINMGFQKTPDVKLVVAINLATVGSFSLLAGLIALPLKPKEWCVRFVPWVDSGRRRLHCRSRSSLLRIAHLYGRRRTSLRAVCSNAREKNGRERYNQAQMDVRAVLALA